MKRLLLLSSLVLSTSLLAVTNIPLDQQVGSFTVTEISAEEARTLNAGGLDGNTTGAHGKVSSGSNESTTGGHGIISFGGGESNKGRVDGGFTGLGTTSGGTPTKPNPGTTTVGTTGGTPGGTVPDPTTTVPYPYPYPYGTGSQEPDNIDRAGKVISTTRELVALGEAIYDLVKKGKPTNTTEYAPISVVPKDPTTKDYVDPFDLEGFSMPTEKNFVAKVKNASGKEVVNFTYKVVYSYGGSFNGTGKYLTGVMIVPSAVRTTFGWDFSAQMKLSGVMNHGTKANPIAGVMITMKYQMNSWTVSFERNDTIYLSGNGELKNMNVQ